MKSILIFALLHVALFGLANNGEEENLTSKINTTDKEGRKQGKWIFFGKDQPEKGYPSDGKISEGVYKNDRKNGKWIIYYKDGVTPKVIGEFVNNRPNGQFQKFYPNGNLKEEATFIGQRYIDTLKRYSVDGVLTYQANYNDAGLETGVVKYFYNNGSPEFIYYAENGTPVGKATRYWSNGDIKEELKFSKEGQWLTSSGVIPKTNPLIEKDKSNLKEAPKFEGVKKNYKPNGYNIIYNKMNEIWMEGEFKNLQLWDGRLYIYDNDGLLMKVEVYKEGVYHSDSQL